MSSYVTTFKDVVYPEKLRFKKWINLIKCFFVLSIAMESNKNSATGLGREPNTFPVLSKRDKKRISKESRKFEARRWKQEKKWRNPFKPKNYLALEENSFCQYTSKNEQLQKYRKKVFELEEILYRQKRLIEKLCKNQCNRMDLEVVTDANDKDSWEKIVAS